jgi:hypothetical protein
VKLPRTYVRGAAALALAAALIGTSALAPVVSASALDDLNPVEAARSTMNKPKDGSDSSIPGIGELPFGELPIGDLPIGELPIGDLPIGDLGIGDLGQGGVENIPIIGEVANTFKDKEPEEVVTSAVQMASVASETVVPLIRGFIR